MTLVDFFYPGETARARDLERRNKELEARRVAAGIDTPEWAGAQEAAFGQNGPDTWNADMEQAAADGALQGFHDLPGKVRGTLTGAVGWSLAWVPWWGWLVGAFLVFVWLGGMEMMRGRLAKS